MMVQASDKVKKLAAEYKEAKTQEEKNRIYKLMFDEMNKPSKRKTN